MVVGGGGGGGGGWWWLESREQTANAESLDGSCLLSA